MTRNAVASVRAGLVEDIVRLAASTYKALPHAIPSEWVELDVTMLQLKTMLLVYIDGPISVGSLASRLQIALPTVSGVLNRLERRGLMERQRDQADRRLVICQLTEEGRERIDRLWELSWARLAKLLEPMTLEQLRIVSEAMTLLHASAQALGAREGVA